MSSKKGQKSSKKFQVKERRIFSETLKRQIISDIDSKVTTIRGISELYGVSRTAVYKWLYKYSPHNKRGTIQVIQMESESEKTKLLLRRVMELEAALGRKQLEADYLNKLIELAGKELNFDLKKNYEPQLLNGFVNIKKVTPTA